MSYAMVTTEDYKFFDFLAPYVWPKYTKKEIALLRKQVDMGIIQIETMLENALAAIGKYKRIAEAYRDFTDNSDAKKAVSQFRNNDIAKDLWMNSFGISGLKNKTGLIRACCYSREQDKFYFFAIPHIAYNGMAKVDVLLDQSTGYKDPVGIPKGKWTKCQVDSFERLASITEKQAEKQWLS
jgi:hypothetical protein